MTTLAILRQHAFLSKPALARSLRLPPHSVELLESGVYPLERVTPECRALLESALQQVLGTSLTLEQLLTEV